MTRAQLQKFDIFDQISFGFFPIELPTVGLVLRLDVCSTDTPKFECKPCSDEIFWSKNLGRCSFAHFLSIFLYFPVNIKYNTYLTSNKAGLGHVTRSAGHG